MEYRYIGDAFDWREASIINEIDDLCILQRPEFQLEKVQSNVSFEHADVIHAGLSFYAHSAFEITASATLSWLFLNPHATIRTVSWKASAHIVWFKKGTLAKLDVTRYYANVHLKMADLAYQVMLQGGIVFNEPSLAVSRTDERPIVISRSDEIRFLKYNHLRQALSFVAPLQAFFSLRTKRLTRATGNFQNAFTGSIRLKHIPTYSVILPTINRYDYLDKAIKSLLENKFPPAEVIVVDQTAPKNRIANYYNQFPQDIVKVFFLDKPGQCSARNKAVSEATHDWLLFFDDDSVAWPEMITEHIKLLEFSVATVSTGLSLAPWKDLSYISPEINFYHISPVMDTGNCMMHKESIRKVGGFDLAFDRGSGADDNLGKRLHLNGEILVLNPYAIRTHYKASTGGLRQHGAWWKNKGTLFGPLPLPTESYNLLTFYPRKFYFRMCMLKLFTSYRRTSWMHRIVNTLLFPIKLLRSYRQAQVLIRER
jgi:glycosyltransferase involved in cell wall biosynthesis